MSFDIALTGLNAAGQQLEVISNNIANSNTTGFKKSRTEFADVYAKSDLGIAAETPGSGVQVANIRQEFSQGNITFTENNLDLSISGQGFFRMDDNGSISYTRAGQFGLDRDGNIASNAGHHLTGYLAGANGTITPKIGTLTIDKGDLSPVASDSITLTVNMDSQADVPDVAFDVDNPNSYNFSTSATVYDSLGTTHVMETYFRKDSANNWSSSTFSEGLEISNSTFAFDSNGALNQIDGLDPGVVLITDYQPDPNVGPVTVQVDYTSMTQFNNPFGVNELQVNGHSTGRLTGLDIDDTGIVFGRYNNGESLAMGQIAITNFADSNGLSQLGDTEWQETFTSGAPATGKPGSASLGLIQSGALEESNVDITKALVDMIGAQRDFQANAQIISVTDTLTQTVINIRR